MVRPIS